MTENLGTKPKVNGWQVGDVGVGAVGEEMGPLVDPLGGQKEDPMIEVVLLHHQQTIIAVLLLPTLLPMKQTRIVEALPPMPTGVGPIMTEIVLLVYHLMLLILLIRPEIVACRPLIPGMGVQPLLLV